MSDKLFIQRCVHIRPQIVNPSHIHNVHELYYLESGKTTYFVGNEIYVIRPGEFVFIPKGEFHHTANEESGDVERLLFTFDNDFVGSTCFVYLKELLNERHIRISEEYSADIKYMLNRIEQEHKEMLRGSSDMLKMYFRQLLILISRHRQYVKKSELSENHRLIQDAAKYISANCSQDLCLDTLSKKYAVSPGYFSKLFKKITGVGLCEYINISRINAAQELLETSNLPITQVALECGFNDSNYFTQVFKQLKGITPKKYSIQSKKH